MASHDKTEKATPKRRKEARKQGQVAKSTDLNGAVVLGAGLVGVMFMGPRVVDGVASSMRAIFAQVSNPGAAMSAAGLHGLLQIALHVILTTVAPIAGMCFAAAFVANVAQVSFRPSFAAIKPNFKKVNPMTGFKNSKMRWRTSAFIPIALPTTTTGSPKLSRATRSARSWLTFSTRSSTRMNAP